MSEETELCLLDRILSPGHNFVSWTEICPLSGDKMSIPGDRILSLGQNSVSGTNNPSPVRRQSRYPGRQKSVPGDRILSQRQNSVSWTEIYPLSGDKIVSRETKICPRDRILSQEIEFCLLDRNLSPGPLRTLEGKLPGAPRGIQG